VREKSLGVELLLWEKEGIICHLNNFKRKKPRKKTRISKSLLKDVEKSSLSRIKSKAGQGGKASG